MRIIVDAHEDIAWNVLTYGRDPMRAVAETRRREAEAGIATHQGPALTGYPEWARGGVALVFATLHATPERRRTGDWEKVCYNTSDEAYALCRAQLDVYRRLVEHHGDQFRLVSTRSEMEAVLGSWVGDSPALPQVGLIQLIEGADCVRSPEELPEWYDAGVRIVGPSWASTRYAGGTREPGPLTAEGRRLLQVMAELGMLLDLSHMSDESAFESLDRYEGTLLASHSNVRALMDGSPIPERHLSDAMIQRIVEREGIIGAIPYNRFLKGGWLPEHGRDIVPLSRIVEHIDYICQLAGDAKHVGLGSDFDGGFGLTQVPVGLDSVADLRLIGDCLAIAGYSVQDVEGILSGNWLRLLRHGLPES